MGAFLKSLDELWSKGQLRDLEADLDRFIKDNLPEIRKAVLEGKSGDQQVARRRYLKGEISDRQLVDYCVRSVLRVRGTCNARRDILEQKGEIDKEVWYEGERSKRPVAAERREEIARTWARSHASQWREWRLFQLLYVWEKKAEAYVPLITPRPVQQG
ncbi:MAG TPA: hypothetical protein VJB14_03350 [Planctomycetota bacterium]|nr:hypothetical protein [Planctomycetota bacterium]